MIGGNVTAIGGNPHVASFLGSSFNSANRLGLSEMYPNIVAVTAAILESVTSKAELDAPKERGFEVASASAGQNQSPHSFPEISSGKDGVSLA